jgi:hypothetical protein
MASGPGLGQQIAKPRPVAVHIGIQSDQALALDVGLAGYHRELTTHLAGDRVGPGVVGPDHLLGCGSASGRRDWAEPSRCAAAA